MMSIYLAPSTALTSIFDPILASQYSEIPEFTNGSDAVHSYFQPIDPE